MDIVHVIFLAILQGITEFLPISSSAHLLLVPAVLGWAEQGLAFDVAVHVGSLVAVVFYFRRDLAALWCGWWAHISCGVKTEQSQLVWMLILATLPAATLGWLAHDIIVEHLRTVPILAWMCIIFGIVLAASDKYGSQQKTLVAITFKVALIVGCAQALALIPGVSRSGITMTAALLLGFQRDAAARFSFLLSIPIIVLSGSYESLRLIDLDVVAWRDLVLGAVFSAVSAYFCIHYFLKLINRIGMMPFVIYRLLLGAALLLLL